MKIAYCSDIHLEFAQIELHNTEDADVLVLAGDILIANDLQANGDRHYLNGREFQVKRSDRFHAFFQQCCEEFPHVIFICGNHEHYHGDFPTTYEKIREHLSYLKNLIILDKETVMLGDVLFIGGTLWTDMNKEDPVTIHMISGMMNDFIQVKNSNRPMLGAYKPAKFQPVDALQDHKKMMDVLTNELKDDNIHKVVVVGHHAPSKASIKPRYSGDEIMNGGYSSDLSEFILDHPKIKTWIHGHTHDVFDYMIGSTRVLCNPRGYDGYEMRASEFKLQYFEI